MTREKIAPIPTNRNNLLLDFSCINFPFGLFPNELNAQNRG
jgi:hypothetical protein